MAQVRRDDAGRYRDPRGRFAKSYSRQFEEIDVGGVSSGRVEGITDWEMVSSSRVRAVRYDYEEQKLCVKFIKLGLNLGLAYVYHDVPAVVYMQFVTSDSKGRYINSVLNQFSYAPATDEELLQYFDGERYA